MHYLSHAASHVQSQPLTLSAVRLRLREVSIFCPTCCLQNRIPGVLQIDPCAASEGPMRLVQLISVDAWEGKRGPYR